MGQCIARLNKSPDVSGTSHPRSRSSRYGLALLRLPRHFSRHQISSCERRNPIRVATNLSISISISISVSVWRHPTVSILASILASWHPTHQPPSHLRPLLTRLTARGSQLAPRSSHCSPPSAFRPFFSSPPPLPSLQPAAFLDSPHLHLLHPPRVREPAKPSNSIQRVAVSKAGRWTRNCRRVAEESRENSPETRPRLCPAHTVSDSSPAW